MMILSETTFGFLNPLIHLSCKKNKTALDSESGRGREKERAHGQDNKGH